MDFDLDDALDSDDSFFEDPKALTKRASLTKTPEKKSLDSLFGLADKSSNDIVSKNESGFPSKPKQTVKFEDSVPETEKNPTISRKPKDDWLLDSTNSPGDKGKKTDFLEDILSIKPKAAKPERKVTSLEDILKESKVTAGPKTSTSLKDIKTSEKETSGDFGLFSSGANRERRRGRRGSATGVEDTLGLGLFQDEFQSGDFFSKDKKTGPKTEDFSSRNKTVSDTGIPDWLGVTNKSETTFTERSEKKTSESTPIKQAPKPTTADSEKLIEKIPPKNIESTSSVAVEDFPSQLKPQHINMELQNTFASLQQQESLLLVSMQFKKYEEALKDIKNQQQEILGKQDKQFNALIDEYIMKQQVVENNIRLQQERINNQIQMLISTPLTARNEKINERKDEEEEDQEDSWMPEIINKMKQRHNEEMFVMEESYKKQIDLVEKSSSALEDKLQNELKTMSEIFDEKVTALRKKHEEEIAHYEEKMKECKQKHSEEIKSLRDNHRKVIEEIKLDHDNQIDYIKEMKRKEQNILENGSILTEKIDSGIEMLTSSTKTLQEIEEKVYQTHDVLAIAREKSIESKEKEIVLMRNTLQKCRDSAENERAQLMALVRNLETKIAEQSANAQEDRWALQQAAATLSARATALEREAEFNRNSIEREREQLKTLKESLLAEQEKMITQLTEEKLLISTEKVRLETSSKLTTNFEAEKAKREAETAIQVTKELTEKVNQEREALFRQKSELETARRNLADRERELTEKETELDLLVQETNRKLKENRKLLTNAKRVENIYNERLQELQNQWVSISNREKKLSEEKIQLSKERLALYTSSKTSKTKNCVLCKPEEVLLHHEGTSASNMNIQDDIIATTGLDTSTLRMRLEACDDAESEVSKEESNSAKINVLLV
nr:fas-binding factor 1-like [Leptinotarsa decemlineata]